MPRLAPALLGLAVLLSACAPPHGFPPSGGQTPADPPPASAPAPRPELDSCGGNEVLGLIGQPVSALPANGGWNTLRVIGPGMMITQDYSATRLDVTVDGAGLILDLFCG